MQKHTERKPQTRSLTNYKSLYIVITNGNTWGRATDLDQALDNANAGGKRVTVLVLPDCFADDSILTDYQISDIDGGVSLSWREDFVKDMDVDDVREMSRSRSIKGECLYFNDRYWISPDVEARELHEDSTEYYDYYFGDLLEYLRDLAEDEVIKFPNGKAERLYRAALEKLELSIDASYD